MYESADCVVWLHMCSMLSTAEYEHELGVGRGELEASRVPGRRCTAGVSVPCHAIYVMTGVRKYFVLTQKFHKC